MSDESFSPSDMMAMMNGNNGGMNGMWNNPFMYLIWLAIFGGAWGGGGFGNNANNSAMQNALTRADLTDGLNNQNTQNDLRSINDAVFGVDSAIQSSANGISQQLCSGFNNTNTNMLSGFNNTNSNVLSGLNNINTSMLNGFNNINMASLQNTNGVIGAINQMAANQQLANCGLSHAIQDNKYEMAQNTTAITNAVHQEAEATRNAMVEQQIQELRDSREAVQRDLQSAQITLANANQTQNILGSLGRYVAYTGCGSNCSGF